jgi:hypothetical protein
MPYQWAAAYVGLAVVFWLLWMVGREQDAPAAADASA